MTRIGDDDVIEVRACCLNCHWAGWDGDENTTGICKAPIPTAYRLNIYIHSVEKTKLNPNDIPYTNPMIFASSPFVECPAWKKEK